MGSDTIHSENDALAHRQRSIKGFFLTSREEMFGDIARLLLEKLEELRKSPPAYNEDCALTAADFEDLVGWNRLDPEYFPGDELPETLEELFDVHYDQYLPRKNGIGYPIGPLHLHISIALSEWITEGKCVGRQFKAYDQLDEGDYPVSRASTFDSLNEEVRGSGSLWSHWNDEERKFFLGQLILKLGKRGLLDILGCRKTLGTHENFPPPRELLLKAFESHHTDRSHLTTGARALAKHHHRDSASFWGSSTGTESDKNKHALEVARKILNNATWINIHELPGQLPIIEMRVDEGYGARWSVDGSSFRGFLEPMMKEGWLNKYRH